MDVTQGFMLTQCISFLFRAHAQTSRESISASRGSCVKMCTAIERYCCALFVNSMGVRLVLCFKTFIFNKPIWAGKRVFLHNRVLLHEAVIVIMGTGGKLWLFLFDGCQRRNEYSVLYVSKVAEDTIHRGSFSCYGIVGARLVCTLTR